MKHFQLLATALLALLVDVDGCTTDSSYTVEARTTSTVKVCTQLRIPLSITSTAIGFVFPPLRDNKDASNFAFNTFLRRNPPLPTVNGSETISATYTIDAEFCTPLIPTARSTTLHLLTPGIGFDKSYWNIPVPSINPTNQYSYVNHMVSQGYSTLSYSRLGSGLSSYPDPYLSTQSGADLAILHSLSTLLRSQSASPLTALGLHSGLSKLIHVGHSYGSILVHALIAAFPTLSDGAVLTGYNANLQYLAPTLSSWDVQLAALNQPLRFGLLSKGYLTWSDAIAAATFFLATPPDDVAGVRYEDAILDYVEDNKGASSIGVVYTSAALNRTATAFKGPVLVVTGQWDAPYCGGDCSGGVLDGTRALLPNANPFEILIHPNTAHCINLSFNATGAYEAIEGFLASSGF